MSSTLITGGDIPAEGIVRNVSQTVIVPETNTRLFRYTVEFAELPEVDIGRPLQSTPAGMISGDVVDFSASRRGGIWTADIAIVEPFRDFATQRIVIATFLGTNRTSLRARPGREKRSNTRTLAVVADVEVKFLEAKELGTFRAPDLDSPPTFEGDIMDFFGGVYDDNGNRVGLTSPAVPPQQFVSDVSMLPVSGVPTWVRIEITKVRRPV